jgi:hypothetical protein
MLLLFSISMFLSFFCLIFFNIRKKKIGGEDAEFLFFLFIGFQILHAFLPDISIHCALIEYAYTRLRVYV